MVGISGLILKCSFELECYCLVWFMVDVLCGCVFVFYGVVECDGESYL